MGALQIREWAIAAGFLLLIPLGLLGALELSTGSATELAYMLHDPSNVFARTVTILLLALVPAPGLVFLPQRMEPGAQSARLLVGVATASLLLAAAALAIFHFFEGDNAQNPLYFEFLGTFLLSWFVGWVSLVWALVARGGLSFRLT